MRISDWSSDVCSSDLTGYRVDFAGRSLCYVTDTEHDEERLDRNVLELIEGADLVIYDSTYTDEEFSKFRNWGHSTWQEGVRLCDKAGVGKLVLFHHDPSHRSEAPTSELQSLMRQSYAVFCLKTKKKSR